MFFTQSLGPFHKPDNKREFRKIFNQARLILLRDEASLNKLRAIEVDISKVRVCADVVFAEADRFVLEEAKHCGIAPQSIKIAISVLTRNTFPFLPEDFFL